MKKHPIAKRKRALVTHDPYTPLVELPASSVTEARHDGGPFVSFRYVRTELTTRGGRTQVKACQTRFEHGKLSTETFEGELGAGAFEHAVAQAQQVLHEQMASMLRPLTWWLSSPRRRSRCERG